MLLENYDLEKLGPTSINLRLKELYKLKKGKIDFSKKTPETKLISLEKPYTLKPGEFVLGKTIEKINMPENLVGLLLKKGKAFRIGLDIHCSLVDSGYKGEIIFGIHNMSENEIVIRKKMSLNQLIILNTKGKSIPLVTQFIGGEVF